MILRKGAKSFGRLAGQRRLFCAKEGLQKATYKPLILYTAGIAVVGALGGSYYTSRKLAKHNPADGDKDKATTGDDDGAEGGQTLEMSKEARNNAETEQGKDEKQEEDLEEMKIVSELFCSDRLPVPLKELGNNEMLEGTDGLLLLIPPKVDRELFEKVSSMIGNLETLHDIGRASNKDGDQLQAYFVKINNLEGLKKIGERLGLELTTSNDVPLVIIRNKYLDKPRVITLMDLLDNEEKFYSSFKPLKEVTTQNGAKFQKILSELEPEQVVLFEYADPTKGDFKSLRSEFYSKTLHERLGNTKSLDQVFVQAADWLPETSRQKLEHAGIYLLQKDGSRVLAGSEKISLGEGQDQFLLYKVAHDNLESPIDVKELLRQAGNAYYERNLAVNPDLVPKSSEFSLVFKYDCNKLVETQVDSAVEIMKSVREELDKKDIKQDRLRIIMLPYSFSPTEGKAVSLTLRENHKSEKKLDFLFQNKDKEKMKDVLSNHPEITANDSTELQFPEEFGFGTEYIVKFVELGLDGQLKDIIQSELEPHYTRFSRKLCGNNFVDMVKKNDMEQVVFLYSTTCASCKKFTPLYEKLARENIEKQFKLTGKPGILNRLNKDSNDIRGDKNYDSTPVFLYYRGDWKMAPYLYRQNFLTESSLREFLTLTSQFDVLGEDGVASLAKRPRKAVSELLTNTN